MCGANAGAGRGVMVGPWGEVAFSSATVRVLAEEVVAADREGGLAGRRVADGERAAALRLRPIAVVLDELEARMSFEDSHGWVMRPNAELGGVRPVEAVDDGRAEEVLELIRTQRPPAA
jgi:hypothetical protein